VRAAFLVALALFASVAVGVALVVLDGGDEVTSPTTGCTTTTSAWTTTSASSSSSTTASATPPSTTTTTSPPAALGPGSTGAAVLQVERRLEALGYFVGAVDGTFDDDTTHGVTAFQKLAGVARDGLVGPSTTAALATATRPVPRSREGRVLEIDLAHQVLLVAEDGTVRMVLDVSTGKTAGLTPRGHFTIYRQIDGWRHAPLGLLYRPKYFYKGLAIHGYSSVPSAPASHGCVRVTNAEMDWLWSSGVAPIGQPVWIY
jgi:lipoprotein-anchoring transpeptidase ErfK/SrfK